MNTIFGMRTIEPGAQPCFVDATAHPLCYSSDLRFCSACHPDAVTAEPLDLWNLPVRFPGRTRVTGLSVDLVFNQLPLGANGFIRCWQNCVMGYLEIAWATA